jgi:hypothetical protein
VVLLVELRRLGGVMFRMLHMTVRGLRMMRGRFEIAGVIMLCRFAMVPHRMLVMICRIAMMFAHYFHNGLLTKKTSDLVWGSASSASVSLSPIRAAMLRRRSSQFFHRDLARSISTLLAPHACSKAR